MSVKSSTAGPSKSSGNTSADLTDNNNSANMSEKVPDYAAIGLEIAQTLTAANAMPSDSVKTCKAKIYNLFKGIDQAKVDFGIAAYFTVNDPSSQADWGKAHPISIGGITIPATMVVGGIISMAQGDGLLRKFLSSGYEHLAPDVVKHTPGVAEILVARAAGHGIVGAPPISAISWVRGVKTETLANSGTRSILRNRATAGKSNVSVVTDTGHNNPTTPVVKPTNAGQEYF